MRFPELDFLKGLLILLMVSFHTYWDLAFFSLLAINHSLYSISRFIPASFLTISGISLYLNLYKKSYNKIITHSLIILSLGILITLVSLFLFPTNPIYFGILSCIGLSLLLSIPLYRFGKYNIPLSLFLLSIHFLIPYHIHSLNPLTYTIGTHTSEKIYATSIDYFPLFPWISFIILGLGLGSLFYYEGVRQFPLTLPFPHFLQKAGKHSLYIYLAHQPILVTFISIFVHFVHP